MTICSAGRLFKTTLDKEKPLQIVGTVNAYIAIMARKIGIKAIYLSGAGVANSSYGLPDLGVTTLDNVLEDARRITSAVDVPLLVDIDTGFGTAFMIARTVREMIKAGVAAVHIEDQVAAKRCGHRPGKTLVPVEEMADRIKAAVDARCDPDFVIMARTDAFSVEGLEKAVERGVAYKKAGADMLFAEALTGLDQYRTIKEKVGLPILANMTEFGRTPLFPARQLYEAGVDMVLYPLSVNRAMNKAALQVMQTILREGSQKRVLASMQSREELYDFLDYLAYEQKLDDLFGRKKE